MMNFFILLPVAGAITGWIIMHLFFKVLFRPKLPLHVPIVNKKVQGIVPFFQIKAAKSVSQIVEAQLLSAVTSDTGIAPELLNNVTEAAVNAASKRTELKLPTFIPSGVKNKIIEMVGDIVRREFLAFADDLVYSLAKPGNNTSNITSQIEKYIMNYDLFKLEKSNTWSKYTNYIKISASVLGFVSGLIEAWILSSIA